MKRIRRAHPGEILFKEYIAANHLTVYRVAKDPEFQQATSNEDRRIMRPAADPPETQNAIFVVH